MIALVTGAVVGYLLMIACARDSHRYQLYTARESAREHIDSFFCGHFLTYSFRVLDEQAADMFLGVHPSFFDIRVIQNWILSLHSNSYLFKNDKMKLLPKTAGNIAEMSFDKFFEKMLGQLRYFERFKGEAEQAAVKSAKAKVLSLRSEIMARSEQ